MLRKDITTSLIPKNLKKNIELHLKTPKIEK